MALRVASLEAVLELNSRKFEQGLKAADASLGKADKAVKDLTKVSDKLGQALTQTGDRGRSGLSSIDQQAVNAKASLSGMLSAVGGGAARQAEIGIKGVADSTMDLGDAAEAAKKDFQSLGKRMQSSLGRAEKDLNDLGSEAKDAFGDWEKAARDAEKSTDDAGDAAGDASGAFDGIGGAITDIIPGFDKLGALAGAGGPIAAVIAGLAAIGTFAVGALVEQQSLSNVIEARTGAQGRELQELGQIAENVYRNNWGDSMADATDAMIQARQITKQTGEQLQETTIHALFFRDVMGIDLPESLGAVRSASIAFGTDTTAVFDIMTAAIQRAGDPAGDLADTLNEYSIIAAEAGFTLPEFVGAITTGVEAGIRNYDLAADAIKEFTIRIKDDSETTKNALNELFAATDESARAYIELGDEIDQVSMALRENQEALENAEGAYEAQQSVVDDLQRALSDARRELDELSRPNLKGMQEFDDQLFALDQRAKRLQLALLDLEEETPAFEDTRKQLEEVNKEIDRVSLERELTIEPQLRAIERAAKEGTEPIVTYEQALANVAAKKDEIAGLQEAFNTQQAALEPLQAQYNALNSEVERLTDLQGQLEQQMADMVTPADELIAALTRGDISERDIMSMVIQRLKEVDDQVEQNKIGVALFGTQWEDATAQGVLAMDPAITAMNDFEGATKAAEDAVSQGLGPAWETFWRNVKQDAKDFAVSLTELDWEAFLFGNKSERQRALGEVELPKFEHGGTAMAGQAAIVGEAGPEVIVPQQTSTVIPNNALGGLTVIVQGNVYGDSHLEQIMSDAMGQLRMAIVAGAR